MKKKFDVLETANQPVSELDVDDYLEAIQDNRARVRSLAGILLSVCGMLLSACFIVLFFLIKESIVDLPNLVYSLLFLTIIFLILTMISLVYTTYIHSPIAVATRGERLGSQLMIFKKEHSRSRMAVVFLLVAILLFLSSMLVFAHFILVRSSKGDAHINISQPRGKRSG